MSDSKTLMFNNDKLKFIWFWLIVIGLITFFFVIINNKLSHFNQKNNPTVNKHLVSKKKSLSTNKETVVSEKEKKENPINIKKTKGPIIFQDNFSSPRIIEETDQMNESKDKNWWLNSGAFLYVNSRTARTIFGKLDKNDKWRKKYYDYNSSETDDGYRPQNIFRLVTRSKWQNFQQECYFKIHHYEVSPDKHRAASNGLFLFNRYRDSDNLYYTGLRVDGTAVIKKKQGGKYYLMAQRKIFSGKYHRQKNPNLLPKNQWLGLRSEIETVANNKVVIKVFVKLLPKKKWQEVITVEDNGKKYGGPAILDSAFAGVRTDFMDVEFDNYKIKSK